MSETEKDEAPVQEDVFGSQMQETVDEEPKAEPSLSDLFSESGAEEQEEEKPMEDDSDLMELLHSEGDFSELEICFMKKREAEEQEEVNADAERHRLRIYLAGANRRYRRKRCRIQIQDWRCRMSQTIRRNQRSLPAF